MKIYKAIVVLSILFGFNANASLIVIDDKLTSQLNFSDLQWLHFSHTELYSRDEVETRIAENGDLFGWRYATISEARSLILSIGPDASGVDSPANFNGMRLFFDLFGTPTGVPGIRSGSALSNPIDPGYNRMGESTWSTLYYGDLLNNGDASDHGFLRIIDEDFAILAGASDSGFIDSNNWDGDLPQATSIKNFGVASMLVRAQPVNAPATLSIFCAGIIFLICLNRQSVLVRI